MHTTGQSIKQNRVIYFDYLRILAILAIVMLHVATQNWYVADITSLEWKVFNIFDGSTRWAVPVFFMISGALFLAPQKELDMKKVFKKNILRLATAYVFWSAVYSLMGISDGMEIKEAVSVFIYGWYHLWFIFVIAGLYIMLPILRQITASDKITKYFLLIGGIFNILIPRLIYLLRCVNLPGTYTMLDAINSAFSKFKFTVTGSYVFYFILGYYLSQRDLSKGWRKICYIFGLSGFPIAVALTDWYSNKVAYAVENFYNVLSVSSLMMAIGIFVFAKYELTKIKLKPHFQKIIHILSNSCFGVYLVHVFVLSRLDVYCGLNTFSFHPLIAVLVLFILTSLISFAISLLINRLPVLKKYIV